MEKNRKDSYVFKTREITRRDMLSLNILGGKSLLIQNNLVHVHAVKHSNVVNIFIAS